MIHSVSGDLSQSNMDKAKLLGDQQPNNYETLQTDGPEKDKTSETNPEDEASVISKLFMWWFLRPLSYIYKKQSISIEDIYPVRTEYRSKTLYDEFTLYWNKHKERDHRLLWTLAIMFKKQLFTFLIAGNVIFLLGLGQVFLVGKLTSFFNEPIRHDAFPAYISALFIIAIALIYALMRAQLLYAAKRLGMLLRVVLGAAVYTHMLQVPSRTLQRYGAGEIVTFLSTDLEVLAEAPRLLDGAGSFITASAIVPWLMYREVGINSIPSIIYIILGIVLMIAPQILNVKLRGLVAERTAQRIQMMSAIIHNVETMKINCWEKPFGSIMESLRRKEIMRLMLTLVLRISHDFMFLSIPATALLPTIAAYVYKGEKFNPEAVVRLIGYIYLWNYNSSCTAVVVTAGGQGYQTIKRIENFLKQNSSQEISSQKMISDDYDVICKGLSASWSFENLNNGENQIKNVSLEVHKGEMLMIVGPTGAGKSSLLMALLGNLSITNGTKSISDSVAFCPQKPWIFSGSVKENILLGSPFDSRLYNEVVYSCGLLKDLDCFPSGDETIIGERGLTLSGGQKARISLARTIYQNKNVVLLDDPLSAVDSAVGNHIFDKCLKAMLSSKTTVLVTHQIQFLSQCDAIFVLDKNGKSTYFGKYSPEKYIRNQFISLEEDMFNSDREQSSRIIHDKDNIDLLAEDSEHGTVSWSVYLGIFKAGKGLAFFVPGILITVTAHAALKYSDLYLANWANEEIGNSTYKGDHIEIVSDQSKLIMYGALIGLYNGYSIIILSLVAGFVLTACVNLHDNMYKNVLGAKVHFFNKPFGIIINRFSRDIGLLDSLMFFHLYVATHFTFILAGLVVFSCIMLPWLLLVLMPLVVGVLVIYKFGLKSGQELRRLEAVARSPIFSATSNALDGKVTIDALKKKEHFIREFHAKQDVHTSAYNLYVCSFTWIGLYINLTYVIYFIIATCLAFVYEGKGTISCFIIVTLSQGFDEIQLLFMALTEMNILMTSSERILSYIKTPQEEKGPTPLVDSPSKCSDGAHIIFHDVSMQYKGSSTFSLKNISFSIDEGEKIGIVGRTGAGKSSIFKALSRLADFDGNIYIDGKDVMDTPLSSLRQSIAFIPQNPVLFHGSLRLNLDPLNEKDDATLWSVLQDVQLKDFVQSLPERLNTKIGEGIRDISAGQKQLLSFARALLKPSKMVIIDEATANVDIRTDNIIQKTIQEKFKDRTVLTIAHRINTVQYCDKIMVISQGTIKQFDRTEKIVNTY